MRGRKRTGLVGMRVLTDITETYTGSSKMSGQNQPQQAQLGKAPPGTAKPGQRVDPSMAQKQAGQAMQQAVAAQAQAQAAQTQTQTDPTLQKAQPKKAARTPQQRQDDREERDQMLRGNEMPDSLKDDVANIAAQQIQKALNAGKGGTAVQRQTQNVGEIAEAIAPTVALAYTTRHNIGHEAAVKKTTANLTHVLRRVSEGKNSRQKVIEALSDHYDFEFIPEAQSVVEAAISFAEGVLNESEDQLLRGMVEEAKAAAHTEVSQSDYPEASSGETANSYTGLDDSNWPRVRKNKEDDDAIAGHNEVNGKMTSCDADGDPARHRQAKNKKKTMTEGVFDPARREHILESAFSDD